MKALIKIAKKKPDLFLFLVYPEGRANLKEIWLITAVTLFMVSALQLVSLSFGMIVGREWAGNLMLFLTTPPFLFVWLMVAFRRLQDSDHRWFWLWVPMFNLFLLYVMPGDRGENRFGPREYFIK